MLEQHLTAIDVTSHGRIGMNDLSKYTNIKIMLDQCNNVHNIDSTYEGSTKDRRIFKEGVLLQREDKDL